MNDYQTHPTGIYGIEIRGEQGIDDYVARARGFESTEAWREYRSASPERKAAMRKNRNRDNDSADDGDEDRRRTLEFFKANHE